MAILVLAGVCTSFTYAFASDNASATRLSEASVWDGTVFTVSSDDGIYTFDGDGTEGSPYLLNNATDLAKLAANVNYASEVTCYKGKYFKLNCDVNINDKTWTGIGTGTADATTFMGVFDGDGHLIFNLSIKDQQTSGLFGTAGFGAVIKNIGVASGDIFITNGRTGSIIGLVRGDITVSNCFSWADITMNGNGHVGGLIGVMMNGNAGTSRVIENCYYSGTLKAGTTGSKPHMNYAFGGLIGSYWDITTNIKSCYFDGDMDITVFTTAVDQAYQHAVGALVGSFAWTAGITNINNCAVGGSVKYVNEKADFTSYVAGVGHIAGYSAHTLTVTDFSTAAAVTLNGSAVTAGIGNGVTEENQPDIKTVDSITVPLAEGSKCFISAVDTDVNNSLEIGISTGSGSDLPIGEITLPTAPDNLPTYTTDDATELARYNAASKWDGTVYAVNSLDEVYTFEGDGTEKSPYLLNSADDVAKLAANVRFDNFITNYTDEYFLLTCDLDFQNYGWWGIGGCTTTIIWNDNIMFSGIFDGGGHVVYNFNIANTNEEGKQLYYNGFFGYAGMSYCEIKNFGIMNGDVFLGGEGLGPTRTAALIGASRFDIVVNNCFNNANITFVFDGTGEPRVGGLIGAAMNDQYTERIIKDCYNTGDLTLYAKGVTNNCIGGIAGYISDGTGNYIQNCYNTGNLTVYTDSSYLPTDAKFRAIGSLVGSFAWKGTYSFEDCVAGGTIVYNNVNSKYTAPIGALAGYVNESSDFTVTGCSYTDSLKDYPIVGEWAGAAVTASGVSSVVIPMSAENPYFIAAVSESVDNSGDDKKDEDNKPQNNEGETTTAPETDAATEPSSDSGDTVENKKGCGSAIAVMPAGIIALLGVAVTAVKKKR